MARINREQIKLIAETISRQTEKIEPLNFYSYHTPAGEIVAKDMYPALNHPVAVDFFMFVCLHQYGFWLSDDHGYKEPLVGVMNGKPVKGSDLIWRSILKWINQDNHALELKNLSNLNADYVWEKIFCDDNGPIKFADPALRVMLINEYGRSLCAEGMNPKAIVDLANSSSNQLAEFIRLMNKIQGFVGDPFNKKILLLAMALCNRPENFLKVADHRNWQPIVDYHLMRLALRTGMVEITEDDEYLISRRYFVRPAVEHQIRKATHEAFISLIKLTKKSMFEIDVLAWLARRYCPEMQEPDCEKCLFFNSCAKRTKLFQPIFRTINY